MIDHTKRIRLLIFVGAYLILCAVASAQDCSPWVNISRPALVSIAVKKTQKVNGAVISGYGTGFVVSPEGHVVTAYHVVAPDPNTDEMVIMATVGSLYAQPTPLEYVTGDKSKDIAVLVFKDSSRVYDFMLLGDPFRTIPGGALCSFSFAQPLGGDFLTTSGPLSNKRAEDKESGINNLWTTQMPSNPGESGAPVIDLKNGGVVAMKYGGKDPRTTQNFNFLIPLNLAKSLLDDCCNVKIPSPNVNNPTVMSEPVLLGVKVLFVLPQGDNKAPDTVVAISVTAGGILLAGTEIGAGVQFNDPGNYGPFKLETPGRSITKAVYRNSTVTLTIRNSDERIDQINDRWITQVQLEAQFSDQEIIKTRSNVITVDNNNRVVAFMTKQN